MALKFNKYFENNSKCFSTTVTKNNLELNKARMSCNCCYYFWLENCHYSAYFSNCSRYIKSFVECRKNAHNSFPHVFCVSTLPLEAYLLDSYNHIWKTTCSSGFLTFPNTSGRRMNGPSDRTMESPRPPTHPSDLPLS